MPGPTAQTPKQSAPMSSAAEPPRKRQRTNHPNPFVSASRATSRASSPAESSSTAMCSLSFSAPSPGTHTHMSHEGGVDDTRSDTEVPPFGWKDAALPDRTPGGSVGSSADAGPSSVSQCQTNSRPDEDACGDQGDANRLPTGMKGGWKGKARERATPTLDSEDGDMIWEPEGGAISIIKSLTTRTNGNILAIERPAGEDVPVRDGEYYIKSADCVIRVENTLFRVHRYFLGRDASAFQHMFSMPLDGVPPEHMEGYSDENPIRLYGESVERFRALLSVIYELPLELQVYNTPAANVDRLLTIAEMTNKYHFASMEKWAVDALYNVISGLHGPPQRQYELGHCSSPWMKRLLEVALLCGHDGLRNYVAERWVDRIVARDLRPVHALEIADRCGLKRLQGYAYYVQLLELDDKFDPGVIEDGRQHSRSRPGNQPSTAIAAEPNAEGVRAGTPAVLTREQKQRLLSGYWSLTRLWEQLRTTPPKFQRPDGCTYHQHGCLVTWTAVWRDVGRTENTLKALPVDVLGRLKAMEEQLFMHTDLSFALTPQCKRSALLALKATIKEVQDGLADHFADVTAMVVPAADEEEMS